MLTINKLLWLIIKFMVLAGLPLIVVKAVVGGKSEKPKEPESVVGVEQLPNQHAETETVSVPADTNSSKSKLISVSSSCRHGSPVSGHFYVKDRKVNFRTGPGSNNGLVINNKSHTSYRENVLSEAISRYGTSWTLPNKGMVAGKDC